MNTPLQTVVHEIEAGRMTIKIGRTFSLDDIAEAHHVMETNS